MKPIKDKINYDSESEVMPILIRVEERTKKRAKAKSKAPYPSQPPNPAFDRTRVTFGVHFSTSTGAGRSTRALGVFVADIALSIL